MLDNFTYTMLRYKHNHLCVLIFLASLKKNRDEHIIQQYHVNKLFIVDM